MNAQPKLSLDNIRIALISCQYDSEKVAPLGLVYLATCLVKELNIGSDHIRVIDRRSNIKKEVLRFAPHVIGFTAMTVNYGETINFAKSLKRIHDVPYLLGGVHITSLPESMNPVFDVAVLGEGEQTFKELIALFLKEGCFSGNRLQQIQGVLFIDEKTRKIIQTEKRPPIKNIDDLPIPDFNFLHKDYFRPKEVASIGKVCRGMEIISSRGCPYKCKFCSTARFWGTFRMHSPDYTARIIKTLVDDFGMTAIGFRDDLFGVSVKRLKKIREALVRYDVFDKIQAIECTMRTNLMNDEICEAMKALKVVTLNFGFESGSESVLKELKGGGPSVETNKRAILLCRKYGISAYGSLMYGSPGESIEDMKKTNKFIDFAIANKAKYLWSFVSTPFPDTPFWEIALKKGTVSNDMDWGLLQHHGFDNPLLLDESIDKKEFKKVFFQGKKKLRKLKIKLVGSFVVNHPIQTIKLIIKNPFFYFHKVYRKVFKY